MKVIRQATARHLGSWPVEMRMDVVAAFLDYSDTKALSAAIDRGEAPRATSMRCTGAKGMEPIWSAEAVADFIRRRHQNFGAAPKQEEGLERLIRRPDLKALAPRRASRSAK
jgi:hypothetical protein